MGLFSRRRNEGFDPELWSDADDRARDRGTESWFADLDATEGDTDAIDTNAGASFDDTDAEWLQDDPGQIAREKR